MLPKVVSSDFVDAVSITEWNSKSKVFQTHWYKKQYIAPIITTSNPGIKNIRGLWANI